MKFIVTKYFLKVCWVLRTLFGQYVVDIDEVKIALSTRLQRNVSRKIKCAVTKMRGRAHGKGVIFCKFHATATF